MRKHGEQEFLLTLIEVLFILFIVGGAITGASLGASSGLLFAVLGVVAGALAGFASIAVLTLAFFRVVQALPERRAETHPKRPRSRAIGRALGWIGVVCMPAVIAAALYSAWQQDKLLHALPGTLVLALYTWASWLATKR